MKIEQVVQEVEKVILGKRKIVETIAMAILAKGHILLEDIPGVGKTTLALAFHKAMGMDYQRMQFTPDVLPSDVVGFTMFDQKKNEFVYKPGAVMCNLLLGDEINRTSSKTQAALLEVMEEGTVTVDGCTYQVPVPFHVIATQNPYGSAGTQLLPQSQLDRFLVKVSMGYPDFQSQVDILRNRQTKNPLHEVEQITTKEEILQMQKEAEAVEVVEALLQYIIRLVEATRNHPLVQVGVSPRGALAVNDMAKACAYINGRDYVIPEDVDYVFSQVTSHRILLLSKARMEQKTEEDIIKEIVNMVEKPKIQ